MKLLSRNRTEAEASEDQHDERPPADEAPEPQPEHDEPRLEDPGPTHLSKRDYLAILKRAFKRANEDHITNLAAALAYYAFLAIPSALLIAIGLFGIFASPQDVSISSNGRGGRSSRGPRIISTTASRTSASW